MNILIENAQIVDTRFGFDSDGRLIADLTLEGLGFKMHFSETDLEDYDDYLFSSIVYILKMLEVSSWEELKGTFVRVKHNGSKIVAIGHIVKDDWRELDIY